MADSYAIKRLRVPPQLSRARPQKDVREVGWAAFGELARDLAARIAERYRPDVVLGIAKGGVFVGGALAGALQAEFLPVRMERRSRDRGSEARGATERLPSLRGKRVLVVDDVTATGKTLDRAGERVRKAGAAEVKSAVLVKRRGGSKPDWHAIETDELIIFGWDYQLDEPSAASGDPGEVGV